MSESIQLRAVRAFWAGGRRYAPEDVHAFPVLEAAEILATGRAVLANDRDGAAERVREAVAAEALAIVAAQQSAANRSTRRGYF